MIGFKTVARIALLAIAPLFVTGTGIAATFSVTRTDDPAPDGCAAEDCSLREAVIAANMAVGADVIEVPAGTYVNSILGTFEDLSATGDLDILDDVEIRGAGAAETVIDGGGFDRVFHVATPLSGEVGFFDLTVRNGVADGVGGGILNAGGTVTVERCIVRSNTSTTGGGGLYQLINRTFLVEASTLVGNESTSGQGHDLHNNQGTVVLTNSTIASDAELRPPVNLNAGADTTILNSTLIHSDSSAVMIRVDESTLTMTNTIVVGRCLNVDGLSTLSSGGGNVEVTGDSCELDQSSDQVTEPQIDVLPLGDWGGPTPTFDLRLESPAVDAGEGGPCPASDQRGLPRPLDGDGDMVYLCDAGAVERDPPIFTDDFESESTGEWSVTVP